MNYKIIFIQHYDKHKHSFKQNTLGQVEITEMEGRRQRGSRHPLYFDWVCRPGYLVEIEHDYILSPGDRQAVFLTAYTLRTYNELLKISHTILCFLLSISEERDTKFAVKDNFIHSTP